MKHIYWQQQTTKQPLYPNLLWSRPENKQFAGKLLIVGGSSHGFAKPAEAFNESQLAGIGRAEILIPDSLQKVLGKQVLTLGNYAPSTPSGSLGQKALNDLLVYGKQNDALLFAGDLGRNSETAILIERTLHEFNKPIILTDDAIEYIILSAQQAILNSNLVLVLSFSQLQKLAQTLHFPQAFTFSLDLMHLVENLHNLTNKYPELFLVTKYLDHFLVAGNGQVSSTLYEVNLPLWRVKAASHAATWIAQLPTKKFEALNCSLITFLQKI